MNAKASVIICAYNYARFLPRCLESVAAQTRQADEVIVVDDGSTDETPNVVAGFPWVNYIRQEHAGKAAAFNRGFAVSQGDLICHLDADDYWLPKKLERTLDLLSQSDAGGLTHDAVYVDGDDRFLYGSERQADKEGATRQYSLHQVLLMCFVYRPGNAIGGSLGVINTLSVWRNAVSDCFPLPADLGLAVDGALLLGAARRGLLHQPEKLSAYRHHGENHFVADPQSLDFQCRLFQWALKIPGLATNTDKKLLHALALETESHSALQNPKGSLHGAYKAARLIPSLLQLGLIPHWKHLGLPAANLVGWQRIRRALSRSAADR